MWHGFWQSPRLASPLRALRHSLARAPISGSDLWVGAWFAWVGIGALRAPWFEAQPTAAVAALGLSAYVCARARAVGPLALVLLTAVGGSFVPMARNGNLASEFLVAACIYHGGWAGWLGLAAFTCGCARAIPCLVLCALRDWRIVVAALTVVVEVAVIVQPDAVREKIGGRLAVWGMALEAWRERPIVGHGTGSAWHQLLLHESAEFRRIWSDGRGATHVQNDGLEILLEHGMIGMVLFVGALASRRALRRPAAAAVLIMGTLGFPLTQPATSAIFWAALGGHESWRFHRT